MKEDFRQNEYEKEEKPKSNVGRNLIIVTVVVVVGVVLFVLFKDAITAFFKDLLAQAEDMTETPFDKF